MLSALTDFTSATRKGLLNQTTPNSEAASPEILGKIQISQQSTSGSPRNATVQIETLDQTPASAVIVTIEEDLTHQVFVDLS